MTEETAVTPRVDEVLRTAKRHPMDNSPTHRILIAPAPELLDLARQLEREVAALTTELEKANSMEGRQCFYDGCKNLAQWCDGHAAEAELDELQKTTGETMTKKPDLIERLREDLAKKVELFSWEEGASGDKKYAYGFAAMVIRGCDLSQYETEATELRAELDAVKRALAEKEVNAKRYEWLRNLPWDIDDHIGKLQVEPYDKWSVSFFAYPSDPEDHKALDAIIDAALAAKSTEPGKS